MKIVVASGNPVKIAAVEQAFAAQFPGQPIELVPVQAESGVSEQPMTDGQTREGARNRAVNAQAIAPEAHYWVGLEGGIETIGGRLMTFAWMCIRSRSGGFSEARTITLPLPPAVKELVDSGLELGEANDRIFATVNSKQEGGAFGLLTQGRYTRQGVYEQAVSIALIPFVNPLYPESASTSDGKSS